METITLELTKQDAELFRKFREYQDIFSILVDSGVFETQNGVVVLSFNREKILTEINKNVLAYKRMAKPLVVFHAQ
jgi:hypothetical protein